jgi:uncharacterized protein (DUF2235 family)
MLNKGLSATHQGKPDRVHFNHLFTSVNSATGFVKDCVTSFGESNSIFTVFP